MKPSRLFFVIAVLTSIQFPAYSLAEDETATADDIAKIRADAENGNAEAQYQLADAYHKGEGVTQNDDAAFEWYQKAANQGNMDAQRALGFVYRGGSGVPMDKILSYMWFELAAAHGDEHAFELRNDVAWSMTEAQILDARKRAKQWKPTKAE